MYYTYKQIYVQLTMIYCTLPVRDVKRIEQMISNTFFHPTTDNVDKQVIFSLFFFGKTRYYPTLIRVDGGMRDTAQVSQLRLAKIVAVKQRQTKANWFGFPVMGPSYPLQPHDICCFADLSSFEDYLNA